MGLLGWYNVVLLPSLVGFRPDHGLLTCWVSSPRTLKGRVAGPNPLAAFEHIPWASKEQAWSSSWREGRK
jgi:hypothetical protein